MVVDNRIPARVIPLPNGSMVPCNKDGCDKYADCEVQLPSAAKSRPGFTPLCKEHFDRFFIPIDDDDDDDDGDAKNG